jgi:hypothetical protein
LRRRWLRAAPNPAAARLFRQFLLDPPSRAVLARYGFAVPEA